MTTKHQSFKKNQEVSWKWGNGLAHGKISEVFTEKVSRHIKGKEITRHTSVEEPAFLIIQENGQQVLKSASELHF